ncbi:MAG: hypothetical protein ACRDKT_11000 [Actinomycetota bacterium]
MKRIVVIVAALALLVPAGAARASHRPNQYCSSTGDICMSTRLVDGKRVLRIGIFEKYFGRYRLCVVAPDETRECHNFRIRRLGPVYGDNVNWRNNFDPRGRGEYTVIWKSLPDRTRVGRRLGFHI